MSGGKQFEEEVKKLSSYADAKLDKLFRSMLSDLFRATPDDPIQVSRNFRRPVLPLSEATACCQLACKHCVTHTARSFCWTILVCVPFMIDYLTRIKKEQKASIAKTMSIDVREKSPMCLWSRARHCPWLHCFRNHFRSMT